MLTSHTMNNPSHNFGHLSFSRIDHGMRTSWLAFWIMLAVVLPTNSVLGYDPPQNKHSLINDKLDKRLGNPYILGDPYFSDGIDKFNKMILINKLNKMILNDPNLSDNEKEKKIGELFLTLTQLNQTSVENNMQRCPNCNRNLSDKKPLRRCPHCGWKEGSLISPATKRTLNSAASRAAVAAALNNDRMSKTTGIDRNKGKREIGIGLIVAGIAMFKEQPFLAIIMIIGGIIFIVVANQKNKNNKTENGKPAENS